MVPELTYQIITPECPQCLRPVRLTLGPGERDHNGVMVYDGTLTHQGMLLHMSHGCEARAR